MSFDISNNNTAPNPVAETITRHSDNSGHSAIQLIPLGVLIAVLVYLLSFAPACWIMMSWDYGRGYWFDRLYYPILMSCEYGPAPIGDGFTGYVNLPFTRRAVDIDSDGLWFFDGQTELWITRILGL